MPLESSPQIHQETLATALRCDTYAQLSERHSRRSEPTRTILPCTPEETRSIIQNSLELDVLPENLDETIVMVNFVDGKNNDPELEINPDKLRSYLENLQAQAFEDGRPRVLVLPKLFSGNLISLPTFLVIKNNEFIPVLGAGMSKEIIQPLSLLAVKILDEMGLPSSRAFSYTTSPSNLNWRLLETPYAKAPLARLQRSVESLTAYLGDGMVATQVFKAMCRDCFFHTFCFDRNPGSIDLSLIDGLNRREQEILVDAGVRTQKQLINADPETLFARIKRLGKGNIAQWRIRIFQRLSWLFQKGKIELVEEIRPPEEENQIYLDYETIQKDGKSVIYFSGALLVKKSTGEKVYYPNAAYGEDPENEKKSFEDFWSTLKANTEEFKDTGIYYYCCDKRLGDKAFERHGLDENSSYPFKHPNVKWVDVLPIMRKHTRSPWGYSLKTLATILFDEQWKIVHSGKLIELHSKNAAAYWRQANRNPGTDSERESIKALESYNGRDAWYVYKFMNRLQEAKRLIRSSQLPQRLNSGLVQHTLDLEAV